MDWQKIETAPKDGTEIDLWVRPYTGKQYRACSYWWLETQRLWRTNLREHDLPKTDTPTHWMPLPPPPETNHAD